MRVEDVDQAVVAAATRTPFEATPAGVRARARGHDERRGREPAAQDARGAGPLRPPDPAHGRARPGARDGRLALPARCASTRCRRRASPRRCEADGVDGPVARARARGWRWATPRGRACSPRRRARRCAPRWRRSRRAALDGEPGETWRPLLERAERAPRRGRGGGGRRGGGAARARAEGPRAPRDRARARGGRQARRPARPHRGARPGADAHGARLPRPRLPGRGGARGGAGERPRARARRSAPARATRAGCARPPSAARRCARRSS